MPNMDIGAIVALGIVVIPYSCVAIATLPRTIHACIKFLWKSCIALFKWIPGPSARETDKDTSRERILIRQRLAAIRCSYFSNALRVWLHVSGIIALFEFVMHVGALVSSSHASGAPLADNVLATLLAASFIVASAIRIYPQLLNQNTLWIVHAIYMGIIMCDAAYVGLMDEGVHAALGQTLWTSLFVIVGLAYPEALPNFLWSAVWAIIGIVVNLQTGFEGLQPSNVIFNSLATVGFLWLVLAKFRQLQVSLVKAELEAKGHLRAKQTVEIVLADMCDAVVELDGQLVIKKPCSKLAGLLFKSTVGLMGEAFAGMLFSDEDRERFEEFVGPRTVPVEQEESPYGSERASSVYLRLRDADGTAVSAQLFHSCHRDPPSDVCHVLGIREVQDHDHAQTVGQQPGQQMPITSAQAAGGNQNDETASVCSSASCTANDGHAVLAPMIPETKMMEPVSAVLNPTTMEIIGCTVGLKSFTGPLVYKGAVRDIIANYGSTFRSWLQQEVFGRISNTEPSKFEIKLKPLMVKERQRLQFQGDAYVIHARLDVCASDMGLETNVDDEEEYDALCVLAFRDLESRFTSIRRKDQYRSRASTEGPVGAGHGLSL